ncbi:8-amino-7-oxononanoate synthase [Vibrio sp. SM6]|uniref:8-amino-7-oxononanoate synthase n=1 Tax=Vibrio agarilyticus TaxID=2726741 RepID=A0A7X8TMH2_9VIBR|nr:8-amino-7-oxononanoate synthase [Vibrio agarilyticus]NLS11465.1 8-amino-7-oxononanoate synthase [Vibrio agarilyticus]
MPAFNAKIAQALELRKQQGLYRTLQPVFSGNQAELACDDRRYVNFSCNDYLGLASDQSLVHAWQQGLSIYGSGSGASPMVTGFSDAHRNLEASLCEWLGYPRAVLFGSGFSANQALLFTLLDKGDVLLQDKLNHASLMEAGMLSPALMRRFRHNDTAQLDNWLSELSSSDAATLVVTEGVFSMDGDSAPLARLAQLTDKRAWLAVDDAHGIGVVGEYGAGSCALAGIKPNLLVVTFGKALGMSGAAILCDEATGDYLTQFARHHVYSTALPPAQAFALNHAISMVQTQQWRRDKWREWSDYFHDALGDTPAVVNTASPIKPVIIGDAQAAVNAAAACCEQGIWLTAIRPPTVASGRARLRVTLTAGHRFEQIKLLTHTLKRVLGEL